MAVTNYVWDDVSDSVLMETDESDVTSVVYTIRPARVGRMRSQRRGGLTSFYHFDGQGSTRALSGSSQNVTDTAVYTAFGEEVASSGSTTNPFGYRGALGYCANIEFQEIQSRTRLYAPQIGRSSTTIRSLVVDDGNLCEMVALEGIGMSFLNVESHAMGYELAFVNPYSFQPFVLKASIREIDKTKGGRDTFYICWRDVRCEGSPCQRLAAFCKCDHVAIYSKQLGLIRGGFGDVRPPGLPKKRVPTGPEWTCKELSFADRPGGWIDKCLGLTDSLADELHWGKEKGEKCTKATDAGIADCLRSKKKPPQKTPSMFSNCQTDLENALEGCCLRGYHALTNKMMGCCKWISPGI